VFDDRPELIEDGAEDLAQIEGRSDHARHFEERAQFSSPALRFLDESGGVGCRC
jgi:hypothetical protein